MIIIGALSVLVGIVGGLLSGFIIEDLIGVKGDVAEDAVPYTRVIVGGSFSIFFLLQLTSMQRALGSANTPVIILVSGNVLNVFLAVLFIFGDSADMPPMFSWMSGIAKLLHIPKMGLMGAAWATILARTLALIPIVVILARRFKIVRPPKGDRGPHGKEIRQILDLAWPTSAQFVLRIGAMILVQSLIARAYTTESDQTATVAYGLVFRLDTMALFVAMGWGSAARAFVGQNLGAMKDKRATMSGWITAGYGAVTSLVLLIFVLTEGRAILEIFVNADSGDQRPIHIALEYLGAVAPSYIGLGIGVCLGNAMAGAGATRTTMWVDVAVILGFQFAVSVVAVWFFKIEQQNLFRVVAVTNYLSAIVYAVVYARGRWKRSLVPPSSRKPVVTADVT